jgi:DNA-directed RNA polymerase alpha subunit
MVRGYENSKASAVEHVGHIKDILDRLRDLTNERLKAMEIGCLALPGRPYNCLIKVGVKKIGDLVGITWEQLLSIKGLGRYSLDQLIETLRYVGFFIPSGHRNYEPFTLLPRQDL